LNAGKFFFVGGAAATNIARWDGTNWSRSSRNGFASASALTVVDGNVFLIGQEVARGIIEWHGLCGGISGPVWALASRGRDVFVGGQFTQTRTVPMREPLRRYQRPLRLARLAAVPHLSVGLPPITNAVVTTNVFYVLRSR